MTNSQRPVLVHTRAALLGFALIGWCASAGAQQASTTGSNAAGPNGPPDSPTAVNNASALAEVVVTGTRIANSNYTSDSPLVTVNAGQIAAVGQTSLDTVLAQMPQFAGAQGQTINGDVQGATGFTGGQSYSDLRGLGPQRTLVLVDGQRIVPTNPTRPLNLTQTPLPPLTASP